MVFLVLAAAWWLGGCAGTPAARTFYVSPVGSDANPGTSPGQPFQHIQRCAEVVMPGDTCEILAGTYRETVTPARSGTATAPIVYRADPGAVVTVDGADPVAGWRPVGVAAIRQLEAQDPQLGESPFARAAQAGQIEAVAVPAPVGQVFWGGRALVQAQWPYPGSDPLAPRAEYAAPGSSDTTIVDRALIEPPGYWDGAQITVSYDFVTETGTVTRSEPGRLTVGGLPHPGCGGGVAAYATHARYVLTGKPEALVHPGEWLYDAGSLYLWPPAGAPAPVEVKERTLAFDLSRASHIRIEGLQLFAASIETGPGTTDDALDGIQASYVSQLDAAVPRGPACAVLSTGALDTGLLIQGSDSMVRDSAVTFSAGDGIALTGRDDTATGDVIRDVDTMGTYAAGIVLAGVGDEATHDTIQNVGRSGIQMYTPADGAAGSVIAYNDIGGFARLSVDTGAIYTCCGKDLAGARIDHNWLHDAEPLPGAVARPEPGIYLDNGTHRALVYANVGWGLDEAVLVNNDSLSGLGPSPDDLIAFNDGGVVMTVSAATGTRIVDNIGAVRVPAGAGATIDHNLPPGVDPRYVDAAAHDFQLRAGSPAVGAGVVIPGLVMPFVGAQPSIGAYQEGEPAWRAGAPAG